MAKTGKTIGEIMLIRSRYHIRSRNGKEVIKVSAEEAEQLAKATGIFDRRTGYVRQEDETGVQAGRFWKD